MYYYAVACQFSLKLTNRSGATDVLDTDLSSKVIYDNLL